jgi:hypothetical protein
MKSSVNSLRRQKMKSSVNSYKSLNCRKCSVLVTNCGENATAVICSICTLMAVGLPDPPKKKPVPTGRPLGWHFMKEFVDKDGNVFHKGKEVRKLKGTLKPTKIKPKKKAIKRRSQQEILLARELEKKAALKKALKQQKDFINHNAMLGGFDVKKA